MQRNRSCLIPAVQVASMLAVSTIFFTPRAANAFGEQFEAPERTEVVTPKPKPRPQPKAPPKKRYSKPKSSAPVPSAPRKPTYGHVEMFWYSGRKICSSQGQSCNKAAVWRFDAPFDDQYVAFLEVPTSYCSDTLLDVRINNRVVGKTAWLGPGGSQEISLGKLTKGMNTLSVNATGRPGGCNSGQLENWGVDITVKN